MSDDTLLRVDELVVRFPIKANGQKLYIRPVDRVSFSIRAGEVLALVGESGSGKTTIGKTMMRILEPASGSILFDQKEVGHVRGKELMEYRTSVQMIFQDPFGSLNPVRTIEQHLQFPLQKHQGLRGQALGLRITDLLEQVGLTPVAETRVKYPHELSGGQRQRVAIARALAVGPRFLVADEPISMLDVSIRAGILKLMNELKEQYRLAFLYITHDLASARYFGDRIMVMYGGKIMESADSRELLRKPLHPYTQLLLAATPGHEEKRALPETSNLPPNLTESRKGCPFAARCPHVTGRCEQEEPALEEVAESHAVACHLVSA
ncbi:ABC transporter ATP-binding protein [Ferroacidibacillus organovorans]|uniref:Dipeptide/oligopeptide/nickel ABC transporter ATP-binding protein n=1 Tax=Ferroacidibacillus organovorans TaxID=1765683 RepID=A0A101XQ42_9BACL|nr:ABC transporter ATP-binding protein [Ferroacidibacillus organovorans]KUO95505.1 dipeptide/oligopeptide/nickel ABC transporter ATP-binding protein [Ferroacidibacillus organovorans]